MNEQVKLAKSEEQPIRKYRTVFTSTKDHKAYVVDLKKLDGDLWTNSTIIKETISRFVKNKLVIKR